jgi:hypothetical protein
MEETPPAIRAGSADSGADEALKRARHHKI